MPKGDYKKTKDSIVPLRGVVRDGVLASLLDHNGAELGFPVTGTKDVTGGISLSSGGETISYVDTVRGLQVRNGKLYFNGRYCRELGLNAFSLLVSTLDGSNVNGYMSIIDGAAAMGVKILRFSLTPYSSALLSSALHNGTPVQPLRWSDLQSSYTTLVKSVFDYAFSKGVFLLPTIIHSPSSVVTMWGESIVTAMSTKNSKTRQYFKNLAAAFAREYGSHPALAGYGLANELQLISGNYIAAADYRSVYADLAAAVKSQDPAHAVFTCGLPFILNQVQSRASFSADIASFVSDNPALIDTLDGHVYSDRAWISRNPSATLDSLTESAFDHAQEWMARMVYEGVSAGKPFCMTEIGVKGRIASTGQETLGSTTKFQTLLSAVENSGCQLALVWNYRESNISGQDVWDIREGTARGDAYIALIKATLGRMRDVNRMPAGGKYFDTAATGFPRPNFAATFSGVANVNAQYAGNAAFAGAQGTVLLWARKDATPAAFARAIDAKNSGGTEGWGVMLDGSGLEFGLTLRKADNTEAVNTLGKTPTTFANGEWHMYGYSWDGASYIDLYIDGFWFDKKTAAYSYSPKTAASPVVLGTAVSGASGATVSLANVLYINRMVTAKEVSDYYNYGIVPADGILIPLQADGVTAGALSVSPSIISGSVTFGATGL